MAMTQTERTARATTKADIRAAALLLGGEVLDAAGVIRMEDGQILIITHDGQRISAREASK